ncbi:hypothetical protein Dimus_021029 [Dionaea muscipula]
MAGRRGGSSQRRVREAVCDPCSPDPHCRGLTRGSPSPTAPFHRRAPSSPGLRTHHRRSTVPMPLSSPEPAGFSSSEDGDATAAAVSSSEEEEDEERSDVTPDVASGSRFSPLLVLTNPVQKDYVPAECSISTTSSASSTLSPTAAMLLCQESIAEAVLEEKRTILVRSEWVNSSSSPLLDGLSPVSGVRQGGGDAMGEAEQAIYTRRGGDQPGGSSPGFVEDGGGSRELIDVGEALNPVVNAEVVQ